MATIQDIMSILNSMKETKVETGRIGQRAMEYQGDKYRELGDRIQNLFGTFGARREAEKDRALTRERDTAGISAEKEASEAERLFRAGEGARDRASAEKIAGMRQYGSADKEKETDRAIYGQTLAELGMTFPGGITDEGDFGWDVAKERLEYVLQRYQEVLAGLVEDGVVTKAQASRYFKWLEEEIGAKVIPEQSGASETPPATFYQPNKGEGAFERANEAWRRGPVLSDERLPLGGATTGRPK